MKRFLSLLLVGCFLLGLLPTAAFAAEQDWKQAYQAALRLFPKYTTHSYPFNGETKTYTIDTLYTLYDIDRDALPELIVREDLTKYSVYTFRENRASLCGEFHWAYDNCLYKPAGQGLLVWDGGKGAQHLETISLYTLTNGKLTSNALIKDAVDPASYEELRAYLHDYQLIDEFHQIDDTSYLTGFQESPSPAAADTVAAETILRAKLLTVDHDFDFFRTGKSPVQIIAKHLDPAPAVAWYTVENLIEMYYQSAKAGDTSAKNVANVSCVEFYEYLLFKLLDSQELDYLSITEPFGLIDDLTDESVDTALLKKLVSFGFKSGTRITDKNKSALKEACTAICGTDSVADIGWMDAILVPGKTIDAFASEFVTLYGLQAVSAARADAIQMIGTHTQIPALRTAAENVCQSIRQAQQAGVNYFVSSALDESIDSLFTWFLNKMVDVMCDIHPASKLWKATADTTTFVMDTIFLTDDISTDSIYILGMANIESSLLAAIDQGEAAFLKEPSLENAQKLIALADTLQRELLVGCDLVTAQVNHCERGKLNWNGILNLLTMKKEWKADFGSTLKWIFGDKNSSYEKLRNCVATIKQCVQRADFYAGSVSALELLWQGGSTTPSPWARDEIHKAISYGLLPDYMQNNYQSNITRLEFCALLEAMMPVKTGKTADELADARSQQQGGALRPPFDDALYREVNVVAQLGIINGVSPTKFNPLGEITRQEAATMLYRTADALGYETTDRATADASVAQWAAKGVYFASSKGLMNGTENGFEPEGKYTKEQAILTMVRFFEHVS